MTHDGKTFLKQNITETKKLLIWLIEIRKFPQNRHKLRNILIARRWLENIKWTKSLYLNTFRTFTNK
jgi:hypothetical protein